MKENYYLGLDSKQFHRITYYEWGTPSANPLICVHGLNRNGRDFDYLAQSLVKENDMYVVSPDMAGRGKSDWLANSDDYNYQVYLSDLGALIARLKGEHIGWLGTSMGGILGMILASLPNTPIQYLILNDIGPSIQIAALQRIKKYIDLGHSLIFNDFAEAEAYFRKAMRSFGTLSDEQWQHITQHGTRLNEKDKLEVNVDPGIRRALDKQKLVDVNLWHIWKNIRCPILVLRGAQSDILLPQTVQMMQHLNPQCEVIEFPDVGHAPSLMEKTQIEVIEKWVKKFTW